MKILRTISFLFILLPFVLFSQDQKSRINNFIDEWHQNAADVNMATYFNKIDTAGIFIGTDATEVWTKQEFYVWSKPHFDGGKAWDFKATERNIYFSDDHAYAWFDELLESSSGILRGSGVIIINDDEFKIMHYVLSLPVPNEKFKEVMNVINE